MSFHQSRSDRSETQFRKSGRSAGPNQQRTSSGSYGKGSGGGPGPSPPSISSSPSLSSSRSFKKSHNAQGSQYRVNVPNVNSSDSGSNVSESRSVQNGAHSQSQLHGAFETPVGSSASKQVESSTTQRGTGAVPKAPTSQPASVNPESTGPANQSKAQGDASKGFHFQFGSIGMPIPARTSSAPPNLDEQKRDQARHETYRSMPMPMPNLPTPSASKQQSSRKDTSATAQPSPGEVHQVTKTKKEVHISHPPTANQTHKPSVLPMSMASMQMPFHQQQVSVQFGGHNPQMQSQNVTGTSLQLPLPIALPIGNAPQVQQHMFVPGLQPHPMQPQGMMHQGQGLNFTAQMGPPQLGNMGIGITAQYPQQQGGKFANTRKTPVKITHPETHKEVKLDERSDTHTDGGVSAPRSHTNIPQSQPNKSFAPAHQMNYSYNPNSMFFPAPGSVPLTNSQITPNSQAPRYNYTVSQGPPNISFINSTTIGSLPVSKIGAAMPAVVEPWNSDHFRDVHSIISSASSGTVQVTVKPVTVSVGEKVVDSSLLDTSVGLSKSSRLSVEGGESTVPKSFQAAIKQSSSVSTAASSENLTMSSGSTAPSEEPAPVATNEEDKRRESLSRSSSIKDHQKKPAKKEQVQPQQQVGGLSTSTSSLALQASEPGISSSSEVSDPVEVKTNTITKVTSKGLSEVSRELVSTVDVSTSAPESKAEISGAVNNYSSLDVVQNANVNLAEPAPWECSITEEQVEETLRERSKQDSNTVHIPSQPLTSRYSELDGQTQPEPVLKTAAISNDVSVVGTAERRLDEPSSICKEVGTSRVSDNMSTDRAMGSTDVESLHGSKTSTVDASSSRSCATDQNSAHSITAETPGEIMKNEGEGLENMGAGLASLPTTGTKEKPVPELTRSKSTTGKAKKKRKEILQKADAAGTTSDLYMAYKGPEEKKEVVLPLETVENLSTVVNLKQSPVVAVASEKVVQSKMEPDDWEDAADISTPKLEPSGVGEQSTRPLVQNKDNRDGNLGKKYSRDFLLKFSEQCTELPDGFEIASDIAEVLMGTNISVSHLVDRDSYPSPGRVMDRQTGGPRMDRRGGTMVDDDRWGRVPGSNLGRDMRLDVSYGGNTGFRPGQGGNYGVLRNPRVQMPVQYAGGILSGPMQSMGPQGGMQRSSPDADRWQRATNFQQKGLIPSPTPLQVMHKAEKKYQVGEVADEEEAKQRQLKAILNKLTPQNFDKLFEQVKAVNIDNAVTLTGVISQIFDKALMEPTFCEMYANFCFYLAGELPDFSEDNEKITFKRLLLNKCQEEFERGEREQEEANKVDKEGENKQSDEEREEKRIKARRRMLGNIRLIGELYKKKMLTERIMHECIQKLLGQYESPDEEDVEALCKLMSTIGEMIDHPKAREHMDAYFDRMAKLSSNMKLSSRVRFMLKDAIELRNNKWQQRRKVEGPKKIEEVHRDAAQERQAQTNRLARGSGMNSLSRRAAMDFGPRSAMLSSPTSQMGGFRGLPSQSRGYLIQDVRMDDRQSYDARTMSVPLPHRLMGDDSITLGPQGGLAREMSSRGPPAMSSTPVPDLSSGVGESRRMTVGMNGFSSLSERTVYGSREDLMPRYLPDKFAGPTAFDQMSAQEHNINFANRDTRTPDRSFDRPVTTSPPTRGQGQASTPNVSSEKVCSREQLQDMSLAAIKEFYSARDEEEVASCIKELNSPSFHPSMVSLWVTDSFERKDMERDLLARLLVNLAKSEDSMLSPVQLTKGFESVLSTLEDAVNDAPKAAEFLGRIFGQVIVENVIPLRDIGRMLYEGGEEPGRLIRIGLAGDVLGSVLENVKSIKGETELNEIRMSSNLRLEDFRPPDPKRSRILENLFRG
ncbi:eukaryotic translation initiation factor 4G-like isoform X2 [Mangifera indica]|uniref:eukaryotic translation initiation factor 4G-like isoform X2 n=1 Tax=Mangifera indica TaxID=29780 RepID=UPI001CF9BC9F|nr:eukaryotic translation initiation factor 4G-like isoform X2 [Mangifera indica]